MVSFSYERGPSDLAKIYNHYPVPVCGVCGDTIWANYDLELCHEGEEMERTFFPGNNDWLAEKLEDVDLSFNEMLAEVEAGRAIVLQGEYARLIQPSPAEAELLEALFPNA